MATEKQSIFKDKLKKHKEQKGRKVLALQGSIIGAGLGIGGTTALVGSGLGAVMAPAIVGGIAGAALGGTPRDKQDPKNEHNIKEHLKKNWKIYAAMGATIGTAEALKFSK